LVIPEFEACDVYDRTWEKPVMSGKYTVGFIDLQASCFYAPRLKVWGTDAQGRIIDEIRRPFEEGHNMELPHIYVDHAKEAIINFEVKTAIPSLGEVIRQVRHYQEYEKGRYIVVSPDARWASALDAQGIGFLQAPA
jgi:hypothetical protein